MRNAAIVFALLILGSTAATADVVQFGSGPDQFTMDFTPIGNPGNAADTTGDPNPAGAVPYSYKMGTYEVSRDMVTKANNAAGLEISLSDMTFFGGNIPSHAATGVSWNAAARFVNWLNTSQGYTPAYKFPTQPGDPGYNTFQDIQLWVSGDAGYNAANPFRNSQAHYFLPSVDEWYKAAYFNPGTGTYSDFPTASDSAPTIVTSGTTAGTAVYNNRPGPTDITLAGGLSFYGTMGQGGNVYEWEETESDLVNDSGSSFRHVRGGFWDSSASFLSSSSHTIGNPAVGNDIIGFRVASIPEAGSLLCLLVAAFGVAARFIFCRWSPRRMTS